MLCLDRATGGVGLRPPRDAASKANMHERWPRYSGLRAVVPSCIRIVHTDDHLPGQGLTQHAPPQWNASNRASQAVWSVGTEQPASVINSLPTFCWGPGTSGQFRRPTPF